TFTYKMIDNIFISADVFISTGKSTANPCPIMLYIHAGGWTGGSRANFSTPLFMEFLKRGFVVVSIDYR
ncbi:hypothetical protein BGW36DRAFT_268369, partial [Talaromyces proteolyticus]